MADFNKSVYSLEFDKIRVLVSSFARTEAAKDIILSGLPSSVHAEVKRNLELTFDAVKCINEKGEPPFGNIKDVRDILNRALKGGVLSPAELISLKEIFYISGRIKDYFSTFDNDSSPLIELVSHLSPNKHLVDKTNDIIVSEDTISDSASPALGDIRRKIRNVNNKIKDELSRYTSGSFSKFLQENIVTQRGGRYVIPVKQEYRSEIKGMVHDTSSSGSTYFIEPMIIVDLNNKVKELQIEEEREIERILSSLTGEYSGLSDILIYNFENITEIAVVFAKAAYSFYNGCIMPVINDSIIINLRSVKHPLLDRKTVVPINISLGGEYDTLVITGPNTGGKTVSLKTLGLCCMMAQFGLFIPAAHDSGVCIFDNILADIGDEQSIEQSLSTFSAHMVNTVDILSKCNDGCLVLFDELGAGTDPIEGAALARSILDYVRSKGALCVATTHYSELKAYAFDTTGVVNASCEFDIETLRPTYRLIIGTPGRSNAFAICEKLGIPQEIISEADSLISDDDRRFENVIRSMESSRETYEKSSSEAENLLAQAQKKLEEADRILAESKEESARIKKGAAKRADSIIRGAEASADYVFKELDKLKKKKDAPDFTAYYNEQKSKIKKAEKRAENRLSAKSHEDITLSEEEMNRPFVKGDYVAISGLGIKGHLEEDPDDKGNVIVKNGTFSTRTNIKKLVHAVDDNKKTEKKGTVSYKRTNHLSVPMEIDLRGENGFDGWQRLDKYIDDAKLAGLHSVTVIHGKGTGALKKALLQNIKKDKRIKSFRSGEFGEGDSGVTILEIGG